MGSRRARTPSEPVICAVTSVSVAPARRRAVRTTWVARSLSPSVNQVSSPRRRMASSVAYVSPARPQPRTSSASPASVYVTVSRSGLIARPCSSTSSAVLTTTVRSAPASSMPWASFAPPTPPARTVTRASFTTGRA
ncbi:hypothetical protein D3C74_379490 [compost metagenome]